MKAKIYKLLIFYFKNIKKYEYYTITTNGGVSDYVFSVGK